MKLIKKITAAVTAMAMAASMMSVGASADSTANWSVNYAPGAPAWANHFVANSTITVPSGSSRSSFSDVCSHFSQTTYNGASAYLTVEAYRIKSNGQYETLYMNSFYNSYNGNFNLSQSINANTDLYVVHTLHNNANGCGMNGTCYFPAP